MSKRIVLCSDGTGNAEGKNEGTNVFKIYNAIARHGKTEQVGFYDNGVGTDRNKILRTVGGAFGFGFGKNVKDLYTFLARTYESGDDIFLFGFSRGAATVRAFAGFLHTCGLPNFRDGVSRDRKAQEKVIDTAFDAYRKGGPRAATFKKTHGISVPVKFIGVWDTVSALGFPKDLGSVFDVLEDLADRFFPHSFYEFELNPDIENAVHALSLDDQRASFKPMFYNEKRNQAADTNVEQVWFAGMHSNVGGGYPRQGMSNSALHWMMVKAEAHGLKFKPNKLQRIAESADDTGRMYDSRAGTGIYYRLEPRDLVALTDKKTDRIQIHHSVLHRIDHGTAGYAPGNLPTTFDIVEPNGDLHPAESVRTLNLPDYRSESAKAHEPVRRRQALQSRFIKLSIAAVVLAACAGWRSWPLPDSWPWIMEITTCASLLGCVLLLRKQLPGWMVWTPTIALLGVSGASVLYWFPAYGGWSPVGWVLVWLNEIASWFAPAFLEPTIELALTTYAGVTSFLLFLFVWLWVSAEKHRERCDIAWERARKALRGPRPDLYERRTPPMTNGATGS